MSQIPITNGTQNLSNDALWKVKVKIHAAYIIGILLAIIVLLASVRFGNIQGLADRLSFALTLASLLLAVLAIAYNVVTNTSFSRTISTLEGASRDIARISNSVSEAAKDLSTKVEVIPSKLESMEGKVSEMTLLMKQVPEKQTQIPPDINESNAMEKVVNYFIKYQHPGALIVLYLCSLSLAKKKPFNPMDFTKESGFKFLSASYIIGGNTVFNSIRFVTFQIDDRNYQTTYIHPKLEPVTRPFIEEAINRIIKSDEIKKNLVSDLDQIDKYFSI